MTLTPHVVDTTRPADGAKWKFDAGVTLVFDDMLSRSVPDYATMRRLVLDLGSRFVQKGTDVVDLGASRGAGLAPFVDRFGSTVRHVAVEESEPMLAHLRERFDRLPEGVVQVRQHDLTQGLPKYLRPSLTLAVLTGMFVPPEYRQQLVADVYRATVPGGAMVWVEKTLGASADLDRLLVDAYYDHKRAAGYTQDQIDSKRQSLRGVLMPLTADGNEQLLRSEGWVVQPFWRALNFAGWVAVKPKGG